MGGVHDKGKHQIAIKFPHRLFRQIEKAAAAHDWTAGEYIRNVIIRCNTPHKERHMKNLLINSLIVAGIVAVAAVAYRAQCAYIDKVEVATIGRVLK